MTFGELAVGCGFILTDKLCIKVNSIGAAFLSQVEEGIITYYNSGVLFVPESSTTVEPVLITAVTTSGILLATTTEIGEES